MSDVTEDVERERTSTRRARILGESLDEHAGHHMHVRGREYWCSCGTFRGKLPEDVLPETTDVCEYCGEPGFTFKGW